MNITPAVEQHVTLLADFAHHTPLIGARHAHHPDDFRMAIRSDERHLGFTVTSNMDVRGFMIVEEIIMIVEEIMKRSPSAR